MSIILVDFVTPPPYLYPHDRLTHMPFPRCYNLGPTPSNPLYHPSSWARSQKILLESLPDQRRQLLNLQTTNVSHVINQQTTLSKRNNSIPAASSSS